MNETGFSQAAEAARNDSSLDIQSTFSLAMRASRMGAWRRDMRTNEVWWSRELEEIFGLPPGGFVGTENGFYDFVHPDDQPALSAAVENAVTMQAEYSIEFRFRHADGSWRWMEGRGKAVYSESGEPLQLYGIGLDITCRKQAEAELLRANERFHLAEQALNGFLYEYHLASDQVFRSEGFSRLLGYGPDEIPSTGSAWNTLVHPADLERINAENPQLFAPGASIFHQEYRVQHKDGHWLDVVDHAAVILDRDGQPSRVVGTTIDVSPQKRLSEALETKVAERTAAVEQANRELARSNEELQRFAYVASHDLQEPLRKLQTFGEMIVRKDEAQFTETGRLYFNRMIEAARRMEAMLLSLLEFSRAATTERKFEETDLSELLSDVLTELRDTIDEKKATVEADALPARAIIVVQFRQLLTNLLSNALKYTRPETPVHIRITAGTLPAEELPRRRPGDDDTRWWRLAIQDNGIGFDEAYAERIFELFARLHGRSEYSGSGIGLAICKRVVENHDGFIVATSTPGQGARFEVYLPE